ncbi:hypothetical protein MKK70_19230, partial [Methylobacterium sp. E-041]|uniref:hypothetical protein n=1 Tax=Methylobacterium sp. E-041 TaxID=2836573 RepID=UPI001FBC04C2
QTLSGPIRRDAASDRSVAAGRELRRMDGGHSGIRFQVGDDSTSVAAVPSTSQYALRAIEFRGCDQSWVAEMS